MILCYCVLLLSIAIANDRLQIIAHLSLKLNNKSPINSGRLVYVSRSAAAAGASEEGGWTEDGTAAAAAVAAT